MRLLLLPAWALMVMAAAQPRCDPLTQYVQNDQCCKMCDPGTSMLSLSTCQEPQCKPCGANEYQEKYTTEPKCQLQPYCDPNKNFEVNVGESTKARRTCMCKVGFHCSGEECLTCVPHSTCKKGYGAQSKGTQTHDTVCQKCLHGTFSDEDSWDGACKKWTECGTGFHVKQNGTDISDNICEESSRTHVIVICVVIGILVIVTVAFILWKCQGNRGDATGKVKGCVESCLGEDREPVTILNVNPLIATPSDYFDEESMLHSSKEEDFLRTPEENEDQPSQEISADLRTDKGNFVAQENGKAEILSRQESQTHAF